MKLSVVVSTHQASFEAVSFKGRISESLAAVAAAGYDGAELAVRNAAEVSGSELTALAATHGLGIPAVGTGQMWGDERLSLTAQDESTRATAVARVKEHIALAAELDALVIIGLVRGVFPDAALKEASWEWLVEGLRELGAAADAAGVGIAIEAINRYETAYVNAATDGLDLIERVGRDSIGLLLDTFHMNIEEPDMAASIRMCGDRLFHFHVADSNRWYPGAGHIDFPGLINTLVDTGYDRWVSGEFLPRPDGPTSIAKGLEYLRPIVPR
ncbi:MAG: 5-keto-L-gluconate epimerase [Spirochaeta sp.]|jgi:sugar phosphate isomerase/epimerase|nr:5-keto-L-gluconate epimerase [Spirochaeta sp.]